MLFDPDHVSILFVEPDTSGGLPACVFAEVDAVTVYPFAAFVVTVTSCAAILGVPAANVPNGIVFAVVETFIFELPPLKLPPDETPATVNVKFGSTDAVTAIEVVSSIAKATAVGPSMTVGVTVFVVIST